MRCFVVEHPQSFIGNALCLVMAVENTGIQCIIKVDFVKSFDVFILLGLSLFMLSRHRCYLSLPYFNCFILFSECRTFHCSYLRGSVHYEIRSTGASCKLRRWAVGSGLCVRDMWCAVANYAQKRLHKPFLSGFGGV
jgi:hypothetical protein